MRRAGDSHWLQIQMSKLRLLKPSVACRRVPYNGMWRDDSRAMHCLCEDKGAVGKDLFDQLADLKTRQLITPDLWNWSEELRVLEKTCPP